MEGSSSPCLLLSPVPVGFSSPMLPQLEPANAWITLPGAVNQRQGSLSVPHGDPIKAWMGLSMKTHTGQRSETEAQIITWPRTRWVQPVPEPGPDALFTMKQSEMMLFPKSSCGSRS